MRETIGYIGVGNMGGAIAVALARDHDVMVHDLSGQAVAACVAAGARAASPEQIAVACRTIFLCLPSFDHVRRTLAEDNALLRHAAPGTLIVDQSTSHPLGFRELAEGLAVRSIALVDAPVSGGPRGVQDGSLVVTIGGTAEQFAVAAGILTSVTRNLLHTGPAGTAMMTKVANNYMAAIQATVSMEVLASFRPQTHIFWGVCRHLRSSRSDCRGIDSEDRAVFGETGITGAMKRTPRDRPWTGATDSKRRTGVSLVSGG
jgi:3-hydroxyisobutyrate dehydrogenase